MRGASFPGLVLVVVSSGWTGAAQADTVQLRSGVVIEGTVQPGPPGRLAIVTRLGGTSVEVGEVLSIEYGTTREDEYAVRLAATDTQDPQGLEQLAAWCRQAGLGERARRLEDEARALRGLPPLRKPVPPKAPPPVARPDDGWAADAGQESTRELLALALALREVACQPRARPAAPRRAAAPVRVRTRRAAAPAAVACERPIERPIEHHVERRSRPVRRDQRRPRGLPASSPPRCETPPRIQRDACAPLRPLRAARRGQPFGPQLVLRN